MTPTDEDGRGGRKARIHAANQYASYMQGWRDGAGYSAMRKEFTNRTPDEPLRVAYEHGYTDGRNAHHDANRAATSLYGHEPSIVRLQ